MALKRADFCKKTSKFISTNLGNFVDILRPVLEWCRNSAIRGSGGEPVGIPTGSPRLWITVLETHLVALILKNKQISDWFAPTLIFLFFKAWILHSSLKMYSNKERCCWKQHLYFVSTFQSDNWNLTLIRVRKIVLRRSTRKNRKTSHVPCSSFRLFLVHSFQMISVGRGARFSHPARLIFRWNRVWQARLECQIVKIVRLVRPDF